MHLGYIIHILYFHKGMAVETFLILIVPKPQERGIKGIDMSGMTASCDLLKFLPWSEIACSEMEKFMEAMNQIRYC